MSPGLSLFVTGDTLTGPWVEAWLGAPRFAAYVQAAAGDRGNGLLLYEWNVQLGQALMRDIAHLEVGLRNAYDAVLSERWPGPTHWLLARDSPATTPLMRTKGSGAQRRMVDINHRGRTNVERAIVACGGSAATPGKVMAELSLGFWRSLTANPREQSLWIRYLRHAYPEGTDRREVDEMLQRINTLRNRIAHHEPVYAARPGQLAPAEAHTEIVAVMRMIAPEAAGFVEGNCAVPEVLEARPC
ncbi:hypothetical protein ACIB24_12420 [Spongisporangium articulatum]|uniref:Abi-like protein n=1 Tax=Spongisporangium articulatum TaxID=3362603 RepID=A0ABW8ANB0_9ACTN